MAKIMIVEDDNSLREIYSTALQAEGYEVVSAADGEEALAAAVKEKPDLLILDIMMPKISGFDVLDIMRSTPETKNAKIMMMTALSQQSDKERGERLGADRYLVKSQVSVPDVVVNVQELLNDAPTRSAAADPKQTEATKSQDGIASPDLPVGSFDETPAPTLAQPAPTTTNQNSVPPQPVQPPPSAPTQTSEPAQTPAPPPASDQPTVSNDDAVPSTGNVEQEIDSLRDVRSDPQSEPTTQTPPDNSAPPSEYSTDTSVAEISEAVASSEASKAQMKEVERSISQTKPQVPDIAQPPTPEEPASVAKQAPSPNEAKRSYINKEPTEPLQPPTPPDKSGGLSSKLKAKLQNARSTADSLAEPNTNEAATVNKQIDNFAQQQEQSAPQPATNPKEQSDTPADTAPQTPEAPTANSHDADVSFTPPPSANDENPLGQNSDAFEEAANAPEPLNQSGPAMPGDTVSPASMNDTQSSAPSNPPEAPTQPAPQPEPTKETPAPPPQQTPPAPNPASAVENDGSNNDVNPHDISL